MIRIEIEPVWRFRRDEDSASMLIMLDFLNEIRASGKITRAADETQMSYRHAWNLIEKWSAFFNAPLVERQRGRGTALTPLGEKLVWAGRLQPLSRSSKTAARRPRSTSLIIRLVTEDYVFVCRKTLLDTEPMKRILAVMRSGEFNAAMAALPGYASNDSGVIKPVHEVFRKAD